jgi:hypothetical protein
VQKKKIRGSERPRTLLDTWPLATMRELPNPTLVLLAIMFATHTCSCADFSTISKDCSVDDLALVVKLLPFSNEPTCK